MRKRAASLAAVALLLTACHDRPGGVAPSWHQPSPAVTFPALPSGLVATAQVGDRTELRVYSATDGRLLHKFTLPPVAGEVSFSDDFGYAADYDADTREIHFSARSGDQFRPVDDWNLAMLDLHDPRLQGGGFLPHTERYAVRVLLGDDVETATGKTISFDPAQPMTTIRNDEAPPDGWATDGDVQLGKESLAVTGLSGDAVVTMSDSALIRADIFGKPGRSLLFTCGGRPIGPFRLACRGAGGRAEVGMLTAVPQASTVGFRSLGKLPGRPFTGVFGSPDGKHLLAQRADGFFALPATGGTPRRVFGPLPGGGEITIRSWN